MVYNRSCSCIRHLFSVHERTRRPKAPEKHGKALHTDTGVIGHCFKKLMLSGESGDSVILRAAFGLTLRKIARTAEMVERCALVAFVC